MQAVRHYDNDDIYISLCIYEVAIEKGAFWLPSTTVANNYIYLYPLNIYIILYIYTYIYIYILAYV